MKPRNIITLLIFSLCCSSIHAQTGVNKEKYRQNVDRIDRQILDITHNLAMSGTPGYKQRSTEEPGYPDPNGEGDPDPIRVDMRQGAIVKTGRPLDVAIQGNGFLRFIDGKTGESVYTRCGSLELTPNGNLCLVAGNVVRLLDPAICCPAEYEEISIKENGSVWYKAAGKMELAGNIEVTTFLSPSRLKCLDERFFFETDFSGPPANAKPGENGAGIIKSGSIERSNVDTKKLLRELKRLKTIRRACCKD